MKKKVLSLLLVGAMMTTMLVGCGSTKETTSPEATGEAVDLEAEEAVIEETTEEVEKETVGDATGLATEGKFVVGFDAEYPPYGYMDANGEYTGFDLEMAQALADLNGWELVKTPISWDAKDMELDSGSIDCVWNGFTINGREDKYTWSVPYVDNSQVMLVSEASEITTLEDLAGKAVGVQAGSAALELLQKEDGRKDLADTFSSLQPFPDYNSAFVELQAGAVDAVAMDIGVALYQISSRGEGFKIVEEILTAEQYGVGVKLGNEALRDKINEGLEELLANGTFDKLAEKYELSDMVCLGK
jgi:ABC-type amino acid transport/signal transduction systems, periplasmic component/domain